MNSKAYLSLGSNLEDRGAQLREAIAGLAGLGEVTAVSSFYETEPVEFVAQPDFMNCVVALETRLDAERLLEGLLEIERRMGRSRVVPKGPRKIDIDILLFGDEALDLAGLKIPHPQMTKRRFVLEPLAEIAPGAMHPILKLTARQLLDALPGWQAVRRIEASGWRPPTSGVDHM